MKSDNVPITKHHFAKNSIATFAGRVEYARRLRKLTPTELGRIAGISHSTIYKIERSPESSVTTDIANKIAKALNVSRIWLCWGDGDPTLPDDRFADLHTEEMLKKL